MFWSVFLLVAVLEKCTAVIYQLNDTEYARMPPLYALDEYTSCLLQANGTYCLARFDLFADPPNDLIKLIHEYSEYDLKHYNHAYIQRGICVTKTCKNSIKSNINGSDLDGILERCVNETIWSDHGLQANLSGVYYCDKHGDEKEVENGDRLVAGAFIAVLIINFIGSSYDVISRTLLKGKENKYLTSFSIFRNWQWLMSDTEEARYKLLKGFHGVRVIVLLLMPLPHVMTYNGMPFTDNTHDYERIYDNSLYRVFSNGMMIIQTFFVMSGFLLVYKLQIESERRQITWGLLVKIWIQRWFRLTPAYTALIAFSATWYRFIGSGPVWNLFITHWVRRDCAKFWWQHLLYIHNYAAGEDACALQCWHMPAEMQLFSAGLVVYMLTKRGGRIITLCTLLVLGVVLPGVHVWKSDLNALVLLTPEFYRTFSNDTFYYLHMYGHTNLAAYIMGMSAGYLVYYLQNNKLDLSKYKLCINLMWWIIPFVLFMLFTGDIFFMEGERASLSVRILYAGAHRAIISASIALGLIAFATGVNNPVRRVFEWPGWTVPSRLSYSVYLLHLNILFTFIAFKTTLTTVSMYYLVIIHMGVLGLSFLLSVPFFLLVEAPFNRIMKTMFTQSNEQGNVKKHM